MRENVEELDEISVATSKYDLVVTYYRSLGLDPYKLRGKTGNVLRKSIKNSPAFSAWVKNRQFQEAFNPEDEFLLDEEKIGDKKRHEVEHDLLKLGFQKSEGGEHTIFKHPTKSKDRNDMIAVPRHKTIKKPLAIKIYKQAAGIASRQTASEATESSVKVKNVLKASNKSKKPEVEFYSTGKDLSKKGGSSDCDADS